MSHECLDLQKLKLYCRPNVTSMDEIETRLITTLINTHFVLNINVEKVINALYNSGYLNQNIYGNICRMLKSRALDNIDKAKRIFNYISNKISFVNLLWALGTAGYTDIANLLLHRIDLVKCNSLQDRMTKATIANRRIAYSTLTTLKRIIDNNICINPVAFVRKLAVRYRERLSEANDGPVKQRIAEKYFAILLNEMDNLSFTNNAFVTANALQTELEHVVPLTCSPVLSEATVNCRLAEIYAYNGDLAKSKEVVDAAVVAALAFEQSPELINILYEKVNVIMYEYELNPSLEIQKHLLETGHCGLGIIRDINDEPLELFAVAFILRMVYCLLGLTIRGKPIQGLIISEKSHQNAKYLLHSIENRIYKFGTRRNMFYTIAMARINELNGAIASTKFYLIQAKYMAAQCQFKELQNVDEYLGSLESRP